MNKRLLFSFNIIWIAFIVISFTSCGSDSENTLVVENDKNDLFFPGPLEIPKLDTRYTYIQHDTEYNNKSVMTYCLEYDVEKCHSHWVAFRFDDITRQRNVSRPDIDPFIDDPSLPKAYWIGEKSFGYNYYDLDGNPQTLPNKNNSLIGANQTHDRGHLCASADRLYSKESNEHTFYMTNMSPQISEFNQHFWVAFENLVQNLGRNSFFCDTLYVVKGGTIDKVKIDGRNEDGIRGTIIRDNGSKVVIPKYYFMALLCMRNNQFKSIAFFMEHKEYPYKESGKDVSKETMRTFAISVDELEEITGIDFFHNLPDNIENEVEVSFDPALWSL